MSAEHTCFSLVEKLPTALADLGALCSSAEFSAYTIANDGLLEVEDLGRSRDAVNGCRDTDSYVFTSLPIDVSLRGIRFDQPLCLRMVESFVGAVARPARFSVCSWGFGQDEVLAVIRPCNTKFPSLHGDCRRVDKEGLVLWRIVGAASLRQTAACYEGYIDIAASQQLSLVDDGQIDVGRINDSANCQELLASDGFSRRLVTPSTGAAAVDLANAPQPDSPRVWLPTPELAPIELVNRVASYWYEHPHLIDVDSCPSDWLLVCGTTEHYASTIIDRNSDRIRRFCDALESENNLGLVW